MRLVGKQKIVAPNINFSGNTIRTGLSLADSKEAIKVKDDASYMIMATDGISIVGTKE